MDLDTTNLCDGCKAAVEAGVLEDLYELEREPQIVEESNDIDDQGPATLSLSEEASIIEDIWGSSSEDEIEEIDEHTKILERHRRSKVKMPTGREYDIPSPKPKHQYHFTCKTASGRKTFLRELRRNKYEYRIIEKEMQKTKVSHPNYDFKKYNIIKIEKVINGCLWLQFLHQQRLIHEEVGYVNQRMLFHGTSFATDIVNHGFNESYSNMNGMFGAGLYFAKHSSKANQYVFSSAYAGGCKLHQKFDCKLCERSMILCRVSLGKAKKELVAKPYPHPPSGYNSVVGTPSTKGLNYPEYIIYRKEQAYPEYLITYKLE